MDILVRDRSSSRRLSTRSHPAEAAIWAIVALCVVAGFAALVGVSLRVHHWQVAANEPATARPAPAVILPDNPAQP
jgi:hypothetical protein